MSFDPLSSDGISKGLEWGRKAAVLAAAFCRGDRLAAPAYRQALNEAFSDYLVTRHRYYAAERRWPEYDSGGAGKLRRDPSTDGYQTVTWLANRWLASSNARRAASRSNARSCRLSGSHS